MRRYPNALQIVSLFGHGTGHYRVAGMPMKEVGEALGEASKLGVEISFFSSLTLSIWAMWKL